MLSEDAVPLHRRCLYVEGHLSSRAKRLIHKGLPEAFPLNSRVCFLSYAYADLALPKEFDRMFRYHPDKTLVKRGDEGELVFRPHSLATALSTSIRLVAATQQFSLPCQEIEDGWKTICVLEFPEGVPVMIDELPTVNEWGESSEAVALCSHETLEAIKQRSRAV